MLPNSVPRNIHAPKTIAITMPTCLDPYRDPIPLDRAGNDGAGVPIPRSEAFPKEVSCHGRDAKTLLDSYVIGVSTSSRDVILRGGDRSRRSWRIGLSTHPHTNLFTQVDRTKDPDFFIRFMDEAQKPPAPGRLVGLDASEVMLAEARRRAREFDVPITFEVGDVQALPFPDDTFDVCRAERLLEHLTDPERALAEMVRVTRPGGRIVAFDFDWDTLIIDNPDKETTRTFVLSHSDSIQNGWIGRQLPRLFKEQSLEGLSIDPVQIFVHYVLAELAFGSHLALLQTNGTLDAGRAGQWWEYLQHADERGTLLISFTAFVVVGAKP